MRVLSIIGKILAGILLLFLLIVLFVRSPWGQNIIKDKVFSYLSDKTQTTISLDRLYITFGGDITVEDLYIEDLAKDTLLYSRSLTADIPIWPILTGGGIAVDRVDWDGVRANVYRENEERGFNYQFLLDAFMSSDTTQNIAPDTSSSGMDISIGDVHLSDIEVQYYDQVGGMDAMLDLGKLNVNMDLTDIGKMQFEVGSATLEDSRFSYIQTKPFPESPDTSEAPLPYLALADIQINNVSGLYRSEPDGLEANLDIQDFDLDAPVVDMVHNEINVNRIGLNNSTININIIQDITTDPTVLVTDRADTEFTLEWPAWRVNIDDIALMENNILYQINGEQPVVGEFNSNAIELNHFSLAGENLYLKNETAGGRLSELHFEEGSGMAVDQFRFLWEMDDQHLSLSEIYVKALESQINGNLSARYASIESLINQPENTTIDLDLSDITVDIEEFYRFQPDLRTNPYMKTLALKPITGNLNANGKLSSLKIPDAGIQWGNQTAAFASGNLYHPTDPDQLRFDFSNILIKSTREDLNRFMNEDSLGIRYPSNARITAQLKGSVTDVSANAKLESTLGQVDFTGSFSNKDTLAFTSDIQVVNLQLDTLLQIPEIGSLTLIAKASGQGSDLNALDATLNATIEQFSYNDYPIRDWQLQGKLTDGSGTIGSAYRDSNLNVELNAHVLLDSISPEVDASIDLIGADLAALGVMSKNVKIALQLDAYFKGNASTFTSSATLKEGTLVYDEQSYPMGRMDLQTYVTPDTTSGSFESRMLDFRLESNTSPGGFTKAITHHIESYLNDTLPSMDTISPPVHVLVDASLREDPLLSDIFLTGLQEMDTMKLKVDFHEEDKNLMAFVDVPYLNYSGIEIDSLGFSADSDPENFNLEMGLRKIVAGPLTINRTYFTNEVRNQTLYSHFQAKYKSKELVHFKTEISQQNDSIRIHFDPSDLVFDGKDWEIPPGNQIRFGENKIEFKKFRIQSGEQKLTIDDNPGQEELNVRFEQFNIVNFISYLNPDSLLATGNLNGRITLEEPLGNSALIADLTVNAFHVMQVNMGDLSLYGETEDARNYEANINLKGGEVDLTAEAEYHATENDSDVSMDMAIDRISMNAIESFSMGSIENSQGFVSGQIKVEGSMSDLQYDGQLVFNNASLTPSLLQTPFNLGSQQIAFDNEGINLNNFTISDKDENTFTVNGDISTEDILNPSFDLSMQADGFQVLNASEEDNDLFYGKASFDAKATLTGDLNLPVLNLQLDVGAGTDVTYVMPQGQAALNRREGVVEFVNKENPNDILSEKEEESVVIRGYDIDALLSVGKNASFKVVISEETGDHFKIAGDGDLNFTIDPTGQMSLSGIYTLQDGHYEMNLYNLVNRRFDIGEGSIVSWSGDPFDAKLDVRAIYDVETSPSSLMASQTSAADPSVQNNYQQKLPFLVYLNVDGQLSEPKLTFQLDMPEDARGDLGGQVYGRIQQINEEAQLLNKQVFSLLVLGRFYPDSGSDGSSGGIVNVARDNLNQALSDQLNLFSDKLLGDTGLELNFGLDSYTDYQGQNPQNRTQLDIAAQKKFLDDRLIVKVGSEVDIEGGNTNPQEENPLIGNVSVEYLLTENGQIRVRGFRKNVYENVIDGQTIVSGLALIFTREFNKFNELWMPMLSEKKN